MQLPRYYLPRPPLDLDAATIDAFETLWMHIANSVGVVELSYSLPIPRWQFLCYLADHKPVVLHGSANPNLSELEPRQTNDVSEFGNRCAIYAASDGIWPLYFAILDREQYPMSLSNACFRVITPSGTRSEPYYFFSISQTALQHQPWQTGTVYILPSTSFEQQAPFISADAEIQVMQCASTEAVKPLAKLTVAPDDFPFLSQIRGHDDTVQWQRARADPNGFPWIEDTA